MMKKQKAKKSPNDSQELYNEAKRLIKEEGQTTAYALRETKLLPSTYYAYKKKDEGGTTSSKKSQGTIVSKGKKNQVNRPSGSNNSSHFRVEIQRRGSNSIVVEGAPRDIASIVNRFLSNEE